MTWAGVASIVVGDLNELRWHLQAACAHYPTSWWYPDGTTQSENNAEKAKEICRTCVVRQTCLDYAIDHHEVYGIWGGLRQRERNRYIRDLRKQTQPQKIKTRA